ncbi:MAG: hypothetical protein Q3993_01895 [Filifactor alocis]|nr:hypothetical protein [Filifactor alocis]
MKGSLIFKLFVLGMVLTVGAVASYFVFDYGKHGWKEGYLSMGVQGREETEASGEGLEGELRSLSEIEVDSVNLEVEVVKGEKAGYKIYEKRNKRIDVSNCIELKQEGGVFRIREKEHRVKDVRLKAVLTVEKPEEVEVEFNTVNGSFSANDRLKSFRGDFVNGAVSLMGEESYPIAISTVNAAINIMFDQYNAVLKVETVNGIGVVLDTPLIEVAGFKIGTSNNIDRKVGEGRDLIEVETVNGAININ